jgi:hypothetical protein
MKQNRWYKILVGERRALRSDENRDKHTALMPEEEQVTETAAQLGAS